MARYDFYRPDNTDELNRFYDRYLKGIQNGFERDTPRVRLSLLGFGTIPDGKFFITLNI